MSCCHANFLNPWKPFRGIETPHLPQTELCSCLCCACQTYQACYTDSVLHKYCQCYLHASPRQRSDARSERHGDYSKVISCGYATLP